MERRGRLKGKDWLIVAFGTLLFVGFLLGLYISIPSERWFMPPAGQEGVTVQVRSGSSARDVAKALADAGVVNDERELLNWMVKLKIDRSTRPGTYTIVPGSPWEVAMRLKDSVPSGRRVTVIPGYDRMDLKRILDPQALERALGDDQAFFPEVRPLLPRGTWDRLAYIVPETYLLSGGNEDARSLVYMGSKLWWERVGSRIPSGMSAPEVFRRAVMASVVERESNRDEERPLVASVFFNRLERGMPLQSCATVVYAWRERGERRTQLTYEDLKIRSPYNTYLNQGLPPGPICVPSVSSWNAALSPASSKFLYFRLRGDGRHVFSETFEDHVRNGR